MKGSVSFCDDYFWCVMPGPDFVARPLLFLSGRRRSGGRCVSHDQLRFWCQELHRFAARLFEASQLRFCSLLCLCCEQIWLGKRCLLKQSISVVFSSWAWPISTVLTGHSWPVNCLSTYQSEPSNEIIVRMFPVLTKFISLLYPVSSASVLWIHGLLIVT